MKKIYGILVLAMMAICSVLFVSCGDDDEPAGNSGGSNESALLGSWRWEGFEDYIVFTFTSDHKFNSRDAAFDDDSNSWDIDINNGTWSLDGTIVILKYSNGARDEMTFDGKNLTYNYNGVKIVFSKM